MKRTKLFTFFLLFAGAVGTFSCEEESSPVVEGYITDDVTKKSLAGFEVQVDAIKSPTSMGILSDGKRTTMISTEVCGAVPANQALTWRGKDVCGVFTIRAGADRYSYISWDVEKNGIRKQYLDSVYCPRNTTTEFAINY